jgi:hypothetical protein
MSSEGWDTSKGHSDPLGVWAAAKWTEEDEWIVAGDPSALRRCQRAWARALAHDFPADGDITCDPWTFLPLRETIAITIAAVGPSPQMLTTALAAAAQRMIRVQADGRERGEDEDEFDDEDEDDFDEDEEEFESDYTPNYVSAPERVGDIVGISNIDTKGVRLPWMFRTFLRIVAEELRSAGAVPARIIPFLTPEHSAWLRERGESFPAPEELA